MADSLKAALNEFAALEQQLDMVDKPEQYKPVDAAYSLPKSRNKGLPMDEARQSFCPPRQPGQVASGRYGKADY